MLASLTSPQVASLADFMYQYNPKTGKMEKYYSSRNTTGFNQSTNHILNLR